MLIRLFLISVYFFAGLSPTIHAQSVTLTTILSGLNDANSVYATSDGRLFIIESGKHRLLITNFDGVKLDSLGNQGTGNYQFNHPADVDATNGLRIYVADKNNRRVQIYDRRMQYLTTLGGRSLSGESAQAEPLFLAVSPLRDLFVYDADRRVLISFDPNGVQLNRVLARELDIRSVDGLQVSSSNVFIMDQTSGIIHRLDHNLRYISFTGGFTKLRGITHNQGILWAVDDNKILKLNDQGRADAEYLFPLPVEIRDITFNGNHLFILNSNSVIRATLQDGQ
jgi:hypothetical protein